MDFLIRIKVILFLSVTLGCGQHSSQSDFFQKSGEEKIINESADPLDQMQRAIFDGNLVTIQTLLQRNLVRVDETLPSGRSLLAEATFRIKTRVIRLLKSRGAEIEKSEIEGKTLTDWSESQSEKRKLLRALLKSQKEDESEVMTAVRSGLFTEVRTLIEEDVSLNFREEKGETPLTEAIRNRQMNVLRALFGDPGLDVNLRNYFQQSPLQLAREMKLKAVENELIKRKAHE
jgi:ankyrin repeat protein